MYKHNIYNNFIEDDNDGDCVDNDFLIIIMVIKMLKSTFIHLYLKDELYFNISWNTIINQQQQR